MVRRSHVARRARRGVGALALTVLGACGGSGEVTVVFEGLRGALGTANRPELITLVLYAPRGDGGTVSPDASEPGWNPAAESRRIAPWNGEDTMSVRVLWPDPALVTSLRAQAVVATGQCGDTRTVLAEGEVTGLRPVMGPPARAAIMLRPTSTPIAASGRCL